MAQVDPEALIELIQGKQIEALQAIENRAVRSATLAGFTEIDDAIRTATQNWVKAFGSASAEGEAGSALASMIREAGGSVTKSLAGVHGGAVKAMNGAMEEAMKLALGQSATLVAQASGEAAPQVSLPDPPAAAKADAQAAGKTVKAAEATAKKLLNPTTVLRLGLRGLLAPLATARSAITAIQRMISVNVNRAVDEATKATAKALPKDDEPKLEVWVCSRDACVRCTAYAGEIIAEGKNFPGGLSWDPKSREKSAPAVRPPLHPNCRCRTVPWKASWKKPGQVSLPEAARREAERSIARGFSLPSESNASRVRALKELLKTNPQLPKTVLESARKAAEKGTFPKGRSVPTP